MRRLILGSMAAAVMALGVSAGAFAAPVVHQFDRSPITAHASLQRADYYWNHRHYQHRDWDRHHHHWHFYD
jgi:hypothetical protein